MKKISVGEYRRNVFSAVILEGINRIHFQALNGSADAPECPERLATMGSKMCNAFFCDCLGLDKKTISEIKGSLSESVTFMKDIMAIAEAVADDKAKIAADEKLEIYDSQEVELGTEDKALLDKLFEDKNPKLQVDAIRDATVKALIAEDRKAQEIKDAIDIAKSQVATTSNPNVLEETVGRLNSRGPTSLMNAIMNSVTVSAIKDISESGNFSSVGKVMTENADEIKTRAAMIYALYETSSIMGIVKYTENDVKKIAGSIYYGK